jgi:hypothetical protein
MLQDCMYLCVMVSEMFDLSHNKVRKSVEQPAGISSELRASELKSVKLNCVNVCHLGCFSCELS